MQTGHLTQISKPILWISFALGLVISWAVLSGDHLGKVNLLYLIILYVVFPIVSLFLSFISYFYSPFQFKNLSSLIIKLIQTSGFVFSNYKSDYLKIYQSHASKLVFFYFSQLASISFSVASLLVLFVLLLTTDMHFIWRSTLLSAEHIMLFLNVIASPWAFWSEAQPTLGLVLNSQDDRLASKTSILMGASWWKFVVATQLFYAVLMRFVFLLAIKLLLKKSNQKDAALGSKDFKVESDKEDLSSPPHNNYKQDVVENYALNNWANFETGILDRVQSCLTGECISLLNAGSEATETERLLADRWRETQVILVKSWEPPLAEMSDYMENSNGYILPLDLKYDELLAIKNNHLDEWVRFVSDLSDWHVLKVDRLRGEATTQLPSQK